MLTVYGPRQEVDRLQDSLLAAVQPPFFPVHLTDFRGEVHFKEIGDDDFAVGSAKVRARWVPHRGDDAGLPGRGRRAVAGLRPRPPGAARPPAACPRASSSSASGADLVMHDAQYTDEEFVEKSDWGHSTVAYAVRVAAEAGAKRLLLFHHDPSHDDHQVEQLLGQARRLHDARRLEDISVATEGLTVELGRS